MLDQPLGKSLVSGMNKRKRDAHQACCPMIGECKFGRFGSLSTFEAKEKKTCSIQTATKLQIFAQGEVCFWGVEKWLNNELWCSGGALGSKYKRVFVIKVLKKMF